jgi:hypothetical protein
MRALWSVMMTAGFLVAAVLPIVAAMPSEPTAPALDPSQRVPVAIAQPLAAMDTGILVAIPSTPGPARLPESGMLVLVGSALMGLAAVVRKTTDRHL